MEKPSSYQGDEPFVFVCYAHEDAESVYGEISWLQAQGVNVWYDEGISLGKEWTEALADAIQDCRKFLFFVTPNAVTREHCRRELNFAQEEGRDVLAVHLQPSTVSGGLRLSLNNRQAIFKYELGEDKYRRELRRAVTGELDEAVPQDTQQASSRSPRLAIFALSALVIAVAGAWWLSVPEEDPTATALSDTLQPLNDERANQLSNAIAVLPFDNLSPDPDNAYFAAGVHEEVINQLVKIRDLSVIARTSVMQYAGAQRPINEIANELGVGTVMEGSVRYAGNRVRITAQLIDGQSGAHLWSEAYEENLEDIFGIQLSIATKIAQTLEAEFSATEQVRVATHTTDKPEAYAHYLKALAAWGNYAPTRPVHEALDAAILLDPQFAAALAFKAFVHTVEALVPVFSELTYTAEAQGQLAALAEQFARRALVVDGNQAHAHYALGWTHIINRRWQLSEQSLGKAYALSPNDYLVANGAAWAAAHVNDCQRGVRLMQRSLALNPNDLAGQGNFADLLLQCEMWDQAKRQATLVISLSPSNYGHMLLAQANSFLGDVDGARTSAALVESPGFGLGTIANVYRRIGDSHDAERLFELMRPYTENVAINPEFYFLIHMAVGNYEAAITGLEQALNSGFPWLVARNLHYFSSHPIYDPIRSHPKFAELVRRTGVALEQD